MFFLKISCLLIVVYGILAQDKSQWMKFKEDYNKTYSSVEDENSHKQAFFSNVKLIEKHNENFRKGKTSYEMEINEFADMLPGEFENNLILDFEDDSKCFTEVTKRFKRSPIPDSVNWVERGFTNPVLQQGNCGSCYAFTSVAAIEAHYYVKYNKLIQLSKQDVLNCGHLYGCNGSCGGNPTKVFEMAKNRGILFENDEPYKAKVETCKAEVLDTEDNNKPYVKIAGYCGLDLNNEEGLKRAVALIGPMSVTMRFKESLHYYKQGVYYEPNCESLKFHIVLVVGYGTTQEGKDYWIVRNSWGEDWGDKGHVLMSRNRGNNCGIAKYPRFPFEPVIMNSNERKKKLICNRSSGSNNIIQYF